MQKYKVPPTPMIVYNKVIISQGRRKNGLLFRIAAMRSKIMDIIQGTAKLTVNIRFVGSKFKINRHFSRGYDKFGGNHSR